MPEHIPCVKKYGGVNKYLFLFLVIRQLNDCYFARYGNIKSYRNDDHNTNWTKGFNCLRSKSGQTIITQFFYLS